MRTRPPSQRPFLATLSYVVLLALLAGSVGRIAHASQAAPADAPTGGIPAGLDAIFAHFEQGVSPGCVVGVSLGGELVVARGYGMASLEHAVPLRPGSIFHVASVSKQFTVAAIALLVQDRLLSLDDDIRVHLPEMHETSGNCSEWPGGGDPT
jgi:CubicO group peptidase (beta-lactamase class C family)